MSAPGPPPGMVQPTPEQIQMMQQQLTAEAQRRGISVQQLVEEMKAEAMRQHQQQHQQQQQQQQQQAQQQQQPQTQEIPINGGAPPKPEALALATFLRSQDLKPRTCIFQEKRKDMFKVKRAIRAINSDAYKKARAKNPLLPEVGDRASAENIFKMLPISMLALRVEKHDPHDGHGHGKTKRVKGQWNVQMVRQQEAEDDMYYVWLYDGPQWKQKLYAGGALAAILAVVFFPIWPYTLRLAVWYLSMGMLGLLGLFFAMALVRLVLYIITRLTLRRGWWLYPNLFEDVGFFDSFRPLWAWEETKEDLDAKKAAKRAKRRAKKLKQKAADEAAWEDEREDEDDEEGEEDDEEGDEEEEPKIVETKIEPSAATTGSDAQSGGRKRIPPQASVEEENE